MSNIKISKIKPIKNGIGGVEVTFDKQEGQGMTFINSYKVNYTRPVSPEFRVALAALKAHVFGIFRISDVVDELDISIASVLLDRRDQSIQLNAAVCTPLNSSMKSQLQSGPISDKEYRDFQKLYDDVNLLIKETLLHITQNTPVKALQTVLDFKSEYEATNKKSKVLEMFPEKAFPTEDELRAMPESEMIDICTKLLEERGAFVMVSDDNDNLFEG